MIQARSLFVAALGIACCTSLGWAQVANNKPAAPAKDIVVSEPGELGITTKMRPILPTITASDPLRFALHFEKKDGPIDHSDGELAAQMLDKAATLQTFEIAVKAPGGGWAKLKPDDGKLEPRPSMLLSDGTFLLELAPEKLRTLNVNGAEDLVLPLKWDDQLKPGVYQIAVRGTLKLSTQARTVQEQGKPPMEFPATTKDLTFTSKPISIKVERADMTNQTLAELEKAAIAALKEQETVKAEKLEVQAIDGLAIADDKGNRVIRVRASIPVEKPKPIDGGGIIIGPDFGGGHGYWQYEVTMDAAGKPVSFARARKGFCVARGTPIATPDGDTTVERLHAGQQVWSYDLASKSLVAATVLGTFQSQTDETLLVNDHLRLTAEHPVYAERDGKAAWYTAASLRVGDLLTNDEARPVRIVSIKNVGGEVEVFDVSVDGPHNFFAAGLLVHNKSIAWTPQHFVPWYSLWNRAPAM
jgi:hypothetical protein